MEKMRAKNEKLKIGILSFYYPHLGGSGVITAKLGEHFAKRGHEVHYIGYDTDTNPSHMAELGIQLHKVRKIDYPCLKNEPYVWTLASEICNVDQKHDLDVIHANYAIPHAAAAFLAREQRKMQGKTLPYVVTGHGSDIHTNGKKPNVGPILSLALNSADALTYVSKELQQIAEEELGVTKRGSVISNFVNLNEFHPSKSPLRSELGIPKNAFVVGHVSNFAPIKQTYHFSYLAESLKQGGVLHNVHFLMVGDGKTRASLEERVGKIGARDHFHFIGNKKDKDLLNAYNVMDCFALTSKHEGNPLTILEAMACEKPVVGSDVGGIRDSIEDDGLLFKEGNIEDFEEKIIRLKENKKLRKYFSKRGFQKVLTKHSPDNILNQYLSVFKQVI